MREREVQTSQPDSQLRIQFDDPMAYARAFYTCLFFLHADGKFLIGLDVNCSRVIAFAKVTRRLKLKLNTLFYLRD